MRAEILTIGDELCRGEIVDTNSSWLAEALWDLDITVAWMTSCRDDVADMKQAFGAAAGRADVVLCSGGLGPTDDDLTVEVLAGMLGTRPVVDGPSRERMEARFAAARFKLTPNNFRQVRVPDGARVYPNPAGSAPGFEVILDRASVFCMPGIPRELKAIFDPAVRDRLIELREARGQGAERIAKRIFRVFGLGESHVATRIEGVVAGVAGASLHYQVKFPEVLVKIAVRDSDGAAAAARLAAVDADLRQRLGRHLFGVDGDHLARTLGEALQEAGATLATAESCTGGMVGSLITAIPGSSAYYVGGAITYSNHAKMRQLGVAEATLIEHGAVSEECVVEMARGARERFEADYGVSVSGVAGPGGGTPDKPVGTVWIAVAGPDGERTRLLSWPGDRDRIRRLSAFWALAMTLDMLRPAPDDPDGPARPARPASPASPATEDRDGD